MIANLPKAIQLLVGLVANLFPVSVRRFLTFARIDSLDDGLRRLLVEPDASRRSSMMSIESSTSCSSWRLAATAPTATASLFVAAAAFFLGGRLEATRPEKNGFFWTILPSASTHQ